MHQHTMKPGPKSTAAREITLTRTFNAPRELVFKAWTDPMHIDQWWGPRSFKTKTSEMELKPGGVWRFVMHSEEFGTYPNKVTFIEVIRPERLVYDHGSEDKSEPDFRVTVTFAARGQKTELTMRSVFPTAAARDHVVKQFSAIEGGNQTLDRLGEWLANGV